MGVGKIKRFLFLLAGAFFSFSCSSELLDSPVGDGKDTSASTANILAAPCDLTATRGGIKTVDLAWKGVNGAYRYYVFAADSPFDNFEQIWETSSTNYSYSISSGKNKYFKVQAVNYADVKSGFSNIAMGAAMACPVITSIEMGKEGESAVVNWWMENCSASTYKNDVRYTVTVYGEDKTSVVREITISDGTTNVSITGLNPKTRYFFNVEAYSNNAQTATEASGLMDAETARKLIPGAPVDLTVSKGLSENLVALRWNIPGEVDVSVGNGIFESHNVFFKVFRKYESEKDSDYKLIKSYISDAEADENGTITFVDSDSLIRGNKYIYKVQSFVDGVERTISSDASIASGEGWTVSVPSLKVNGNYETAENENIYNKITFAFNGEFNDEGQVYTYVLRQIKTDIDGNNPETRDQIFNSIDSLNEYKIEFNSPDESSGYYQYEMFVVPAGETDADKMITSAICPIKLLVTSDAGLVPEITGFEVKDGYSEKFIISFDYNASYTYTLNWIPVIDNVNQNPESLELKESELRISAGKAEFVHDAQSGDRRNYILEANNKGITSQAESGIKETLGTAKIIPGAVYYDQIIFSWNDVQKADSYEISAYYADSPAAKFSIAESDVVSAEGKNTCTVKLPSGYSDAAKSGKPVILKVVSKNSVTSNSTAGTDESATLGPALTDEKIIASDNDSITLQWNKVTGAAGYIIGRGRCSDGTSSIVESVDSYFVSADASVINIEGEAVDAGRAAVKVEGDKYIFKDIYAETTDSETSQISYKKNQSQLCWGLEYKYTVIPVLNEKDFEFELKGTKMGLSSNSKIQYENLTSVSGAATGYGIGINAAKAEDSEKIKITWKQPYGCGGKTKTPSLYLRESGSKGSWTVYSAGLVASDKSEVSVEIVPEVSTKAYEFAVVYNNMNTTINLPGSYSNQLAKVMAENSPSEQQNKGYLLSLHGIYGAYAGDFTEQVSWNPYDFNNRSLGPDSYKIQVLNTNTTKGWVTIADIGVDVANDDYGNIAEISAYSESAKISLVNRGTASLQIEPVFDLNGTNTSGVLKVLRDPKHYYRLVASRKVNEELTVESSIGDDLSAFAYRQVTDEEIGRASMLALAYTFYLNDGGKEDYSNVTKQFKYGGKHTFTDSQNRTATFIERERATYEAGAGKFKHHFYLDGYAPQQLTPSGNTVTFLSLTQAESGCAINGDADSYVYGFLGLKTGTEKCGFLNLETKYVYDETMTLNVTAGISEWGNIYDAKIEYYCPDKNTLTLKVTRKGKTTTLVETTNGDVRKSWFPMQIYSASKYEIKTTGYGWWEE